MSVTEAGRSTSLEAQYFKSLLAEAGLNGKSIDLADLLSFLRVAWSHFKGHPFPQSLDQDLIDYLFQALMHDPSLLQAVNDRQLRDFIVEVVHIFFEGADSVRREIFLESCFSKAGHCCNHPQADSNIVQRIAKVWIGLTTGFLAVNHSTTSLTSRLRLAGVLTNRTFAAQLLFHAFSEERGRPLSSVDVKVVHCIVQHPELSLKNTCRLVHSLMTLCSLTQQERQYWIKVLLDKASERLCLSFSILGEVLYCVANLTEVGIWIQHLLRLQWLILGAREGNRKAMSNLSLHPCFKEQSWREKLEKVSLVMEAILLESQDEQAVVAEACLNYFLYEFREYFPLLNPAQIALFFRNIEKWFPPALGRSGPFKQYIVELISDLFLHFGESILEENSKRQLIWMDVYASIVSAFQIDLAWEPNFRKGLDYVANKEGVGDERVTDMIAVYAVLLNLNPRTKKINLMEGGKKQRDFYWHVIKSTHSENLYRNCFVYLHPKMTVEGEGELIVQMIGNKKIGLGIMLSCMEEFFAIRPTMSEDYRIALFKALFVATGERTPVHQRVMTLLLELFYSSHGVRDTKTFILGNEQTIIVVLLKNIILDDPLNKQKASDHLERTPEDYLSFYREPLYSLQLRTLGFLQAHHKDFHQMIDANWIHSLELGLRMVWHRLSGLASTEVGKIMPWNNISRRQILVQKARPQIYSQGKELNAALRVLSAQVIERGNQFLCEIEAKLTSCLFASNPQDNRMQEKEALLRDCCEYWKTKSKIAARNMIFIVNRINIISDANKIIEYYKTKSNQKGLCDSLAEYISRADRLSIEIEDESFEFLDKLCNLNPFKLSAKEQDEMRQCMGGLTLHCAQRERARCIQNWETLHHQLNELEWICWEYEQLQRQLEAIQAKAMTNKSLRERILKNLEDTTK